MRERERKRRVNGKMGKLLFVWNGQKIKAALGKAVKDKWQREESWWLLFCVFLLCGEKDANSSKEFYVDNALTQYRRHRHMPSLILDLPSRFIMLRKIFAIGYVKWIRYRFQLNQSSYLFHWQRTVKSTLNSCSQWGQET